MPEELVPGVKPSARHSQTFGCKGRTRVPDKTSKALDAKARSVLLLRCLSHGKIHIMLEVHRTVDTTCHFLLRGDVFRMNQFQNVVLVFSTELEESIFMESDEAAVDYVTDRHGPPVLNLTCESVACEEDDACGDLDDYNSHHKES